MGQVMECPHCHTTVFVSHETCPKCKRRVDDPSGATGHLTQVTLYDTQALPPLCAQCGRATARTEQLGSAGDALEPLKDAAAMAAALYSPSRAIELWAGRDHGPILRIKVPRCDACSAVGCLTPSFVDADTGYVTLVVHRRFAEALLRLREDQSG